MSGSSINQLRLMCWGENKSPISVRSNRTKYLSKEPSVIGQAYSTKRPAEVDMRRAENSTQLSKSKTSRIL
jgi:hypothetical protein